MDLSEINLTITTLDDERRENTERSPQNFPREGDMTVLPSYT